jgi:Na+/H+ antiporter NhaD/arsenite permease-like protein
MAAWAKVRPRTSPSSVPSFAGLFVMVGALVNTGVIGELSKAAVTATTG